MTFYDRFIFDILMSNYICLRTFLIIFYYKIIAKLGKLSLNGYAEAYDKTREYIMI